MDRRLVEYYERELLHLREMGAEFAAANPIIARQLGLDSYGVQDPYVERLLEGFAFMAARIQLKMDSQFPRFTNSLLGSVFPHMLAPTPSMAIVQFQPDLSEAALAGGIGIPRNTVLRTRGQNADQTSSPCEFRTAHSLTLYPLRVTQAQYHYRDMGILSLPAGLKAKSALRVRLETTIPQPVENLNLADLCFYFSGEASVSRKLYELVFGRGMQLVAQSPSQPAKFQTVVNNWSRAVGFDDDEAMLPYGAQSFQGFRLLQEYFALPQRYQFVRFSDLAAALKGCKTRNVDLILTFSTQEPQLENLVTSENISLFCTPAVNLFPRDTDWIHITTRKSEFPVIVDRNRPLDYEVHQVNSVTGYGTSRHQKQEFSPFYAAIDAESVTTARRAYYDVHRIPRIVTEREKRFGRRSSYLGSEMWLSLVDAENAPHLTDLRQLGISVLCTNRDLPEHLRLSPRDESSFTWEIGAPIKGIRCVVPPTLPRESIGEGDRSWRLISHLGLNYLSLCDKNEREGAAALRELLSLFGDPNDVQHQHQIDGVRHIVSRPVSRRVPAPGPIVFARGLELNVTLDEAMFEGAGVFLLGSVLERFFARYVSVNTFTETVLSTLDSGEIMRWRPTIGKRILL